MRKVVRLTKGFDSIICRVLETWDVPGAAIGIVHAGEVVHAKAYGVRDISRRLLVTETTRFGIGSCTKAFTAAAVAVLVSAGKMDWDKPVRQYLPSFRLHDPLATERTSLRDLLTHRTGLPGHNFAWLASRATRAQMLERLRYLQPSAEFRTKYQYNNLMYMVAGALLEHVTGQTWEQFLDERIFKPLGMGDTFCLHSGMAKAGNLATGYDQVRGHLQPWCRAPGLDMVQCEGPCGPAGAICSNVLDICKWLRLQMGDAKLLKQLGIDSLTLRQMHTPQVVGGEAFPPGVADAELLDASYGMGWAIQPYRGNRMVYHSGLFAGYNSVVSFMPAESLGVVVLTNLRSSPVWRVAMCSAYDRLLGLPSIPWIARWKQYTQRREADSIKTRLQRKIRHARPPCPLTSYVGTYGHPGYGTVRIYLNRGRLCVCYNEVLPFRLKHCHEHTWHMIAPNELYEVTFSQDRRACIDSITVPFESVVPCTFKRLHG